MSDFVTLGEGVEVGLIVLASVGVSVKIGVFEGVEEGDCRKLPDWVVVRDGVVSISELTPGCMLQARSVRIEIIIKPSNQ